MTKRKEGTEITKADIREALKYRRELLKRTLPTVIREDRVDGQKLLVVINR